MINFEWEDDLDDSLEAPRTSGKMVIKDDDGTFRHGYLNEHGEFILHRDGGPAVIRYDGVKLWYQNGLSHRLDGPAIIYSSGTKFWCQNGLYHRLDGPAIIYADGAEEWYINEVSQEDLCERLRMG